MFFNRKPDSRPRFVGIPVNDLTLGHIFLLRSIESPFITGGDIQIGDLLLAVSICSGTYEQGKLHIEDFKVNGEKIASTWGRKCAKCKINPIAEYNRFLEWLEYQREWPGVLSFNKNSSRINSPWELCLKVQAQSILNYDPEKIMDIPVKQIASEITAYNELQGNVHVKGEADYQREDMAKRLGEFLEKKKQELGRELDESELIAVNQEFINQCSQIS